jgi:hypothetical protein
MVALAREGQQVVAVELRAVDEHPAAHDVEEHVGAVVRGGHRIAGALEAVGPGQQLVDAGRVVGARAGDLQRAARTGLEAPCQLEGLHLRIGRVDDQMPFPSGLVQFGVELNQEGAAAAARERLGVQRLAAAEALDLMRRQQGARALGQAAVPGHQGVERFLGFGAIPDLRVQREEAESSAGRRLVPFVGVGQVAHRRCGACADAGRDQVEQAVEHAHAGGRGAALAAQARAAHQAE